MGTQTEGDTKRVVDEVRYKRQTGLYNPADHDVHVTIIGLGNIGSHTGLALARMGIKKFTLVDFDTVEEHNLASQAYRRSDIGAYKAVALEELMREIADVEVSMNMEAYNESIPLYDITVIAVDSMETRHTIESMVRKYHPHTHIVDGRMGGGQIEVHSAKATEWSGTLKEEADIDPCSARYISYTSYIIAGMIANTVKRLLKGEEVRRSTYVHTNTMDVLKI
jgi:molybdopterin/thiamine biosynthesis adenylyltransferase